MTQRLQYPTWAASDPTGLGAPEDTRLTWFQELSLPVLPAVDLSSYPAIFPPTMDPESLGAPETDRLQWFSPLSEPTRRIVEAELGLRILDPATLGDAEDTRLTWFQALAEPVLPRVDLSSEPTWFTIDPVALDLADAATFNVGQAPGIAQVFPAAVVLYPAWAFTVEIEAAPEIVTLDEFSPLALPVPARPVEHPPASDIDAESLGSPEDTRLTWFMALSEPTRRQGEAHPGAYAIDPETLGAPLSDKLEWFQALSVPSVTEPMAIPELAFTHEPEAAAEIVTLDEHQALSLPQASPTVEHPPAGTLDPESLGSPEDTRLTWRADLSLPTRRPPRAAVGEIAQDEESLGAPESDRLQWHAALSIPAFPAARPLGAYAFVDEQAAPAPADTDDFPALSVPIAVPDPSASLLPASIIDPEALAAPLRDELQWFLALSEPALPRPDLSWHPALSIDPTGLADPAVEIVTLDEHAPLSMPVRPPHSSGPLEPAAIIDAETLGDAEADRLQWFVALSTPTFVRQLEPGWLALVDTPEPGEADEIAALSIPVYAEDSSTAMLDASVIDPESLGDAEFDRLQWFERLSLPAHPHRPGAAGWFAFVDEAAAPVDTTDFPALAEPVRAEDRSTAMLPASTIDPETLAEPLRDEMQWFSPLSLPTRIDKLSHLIASGEVRILPQFVQEATPTYRVVVVSAEDRSTATVGSSRIAIVGAEDRAVEADESAREVTTEI